MVYLFLLLTSTIKCISQISQFIVCIIFFFSVESVAEQVIQKLLSSTSTNPEVLHALLQSSLLKNKIGKKTPSVVKKSLGKSPSRAKDPTTNQMHDVGSKILRMFVIDKQIEELMQEKKDIYKDLFSIREISSSLLNSWAQEKIQRKNNGKVASE